MFETGRRATANIKGGDKKRISNAKVVEEGGKYLLKTGDYYINKKGEDVVSKTYFNSKEEAESFLSGLKGEKKQGEEKKDKKPVPMDIDVLKKLKRKELEDLVYGSFKHIENIDYPDMKNIKFVNFFGRGMNMTGYYTDGSNFYVNPYEGGSEKVIMLQKFVPKK